MGTMFLQEVDATIVLADVRDFSPLTQQLNPIDLNLTLSRFYEHIGGIIEGHHGRIVKFMGDGVLGVFIGGDHRLHALEGMAEMVSTRQKFLDENVTQKLPVLDYAIGAASGPVLAGELGTEKLRFYDVLGEPVNQAFRICALATRRGVSNLVDAATWEATKTPGRRPAGIETDAVEFGADKVRLFKLEG